MILFLSNNPCLNFPQDDDGFDVRMAAVSEYLMANCDFSSTQKHAASFIRLLFNANFRSIHCWCKEDISNFREGMNYECIISLPEEVKTWICQERVKHVRYFAAEFATNQPKSKVVKYKAKDWMDRVRRMFTQSTGELHKKQIWVCFLTVR